MAWIESHQELSDHPKKDHLAELLYGDQPMVDIDTADAATIGVLHRLWWWATAYAQDGDLTRFSDHQVARGCRWRGDPHLLVQALTKAGFLDGDRQIHDWRDYAGKLIERRTKDAERKRESRSRDAEERAPETSRGCPPDVHKDGVRTYLTNQPNQEEPSSADEDASLLTLNDEGPQDLFGLFWQPYPRKVGRQEAEEVFRKLPRRDQRAAIQASRNRGKHDKSAGTPKDKIPHPATFLRKARWIDWVKGPPDGYEVTAGGSADPITWAQQTRSCAKCGQPITGDQLADAQPVDHGDSIAWYHGPCWETREDAT